MDKVNAAALAQAATVIVQPTPGDGTSLEERLHTMLDAEPSLAARHFALQIVGGSVECDLDEALLTALGINYEEPSTWPCTGMTYDYYDGSFELKHTREDWEPTPEGLARAWALGFARGWVCYGGDKYGPQTDPNYHEKYYSQK